MPDADVVNTRPLHSLAQRDGQGMLLWNAEVQDAAPPSGEARMTHRERFLEYLERYACRDLAAIDRILAEDVTLTDWNITVVGKAAALAETAKNFAAATNIDITPRNIMEGGCSVSAELHIVVDGSIDLYVVDVIEFAPSGKIAAIRAYRGRGPG